MFLLKILGGLFAITGAALGILSACDDAWETNAITATPPVAYVSPWYIPPHCDILWIASLVVAVILMRLAKKST